MEYVRREIPSERGSVGRVGENPWNVVEEDRLKKYGVKGRFNK